MLGTKGMQITELIESIGPQAFCERIAEMLNSDPPKLRPEDISIKELWLKLQGLEEQVVSTVFPTIMGEVINRKFIESYRAVPTIGDKLTTTVPSNHWTEIFPGIEMPDQLKEVPEGMDYEMAGMGEKKATIDNIKWGRIIAITEETIRFDQTGQILRRASDLGKKAITKKESIILRKIQDLDANVYSGAALYTSGHANLGSTAFGTDGSGMTATELLLNAMKDEAGDPIAIIKRQLLVPRALTKAAWDLYKPPETASTYYKSIIDEILTTPLMANVTAYYYGDFAAQFVWSQVFDIETFQRSGQETFEGWLRDTVAGFKVRFMGNCGALDYKYVIKGVA